MTSRSEVYRSSPAAVILPPADQLRPAMLEASRAVRDPSCKLYTDGHRLAWLPRALPGWFKIAATEVTPQRRAA